MPVASNRTTIYVSTRTPDADTLAGFAALPFTQVRGVRMVGDFGHAWQTQERFVVGDERPTQVKGAFSAQSISLELYRLDDAGRAILRDAAGEVSLRIVEPDGETHYFRALVTSFMRGGFSPGSLADHKLTLSIQSTPITQ